MIKDIKKWMFCKLLGWHKVTRIGHLGFGFQLVGDCDRCKKKNLLQDSQGGWF